LKSRQYNAGRFPAPAICTRADPGRFAILAQQDEQAPIAEAPPGVGEIAQLRPKFRVRRAS
jgi:hypothetical protein